MSTEEHLFERGNVLKHPKYGFGLGLGMFHITGHYRAAYTSVDGVVITTLSTNGWERVDV